MGVAGLDGQGQAELFLALFGARSIQGRSSRGKAYDRAVAGPCPTGRVGLVPRTGPEMVVPDHDDPRQPRAVQLADVSRLGFSAGRHQRPGRRGPTSPEDQVRRSSPQVASLSGGNQQKVLLGRVLACSPRLLLMFDATRGVDVGTKSGDLHVDACRVQQRRREFIFYSSDVAELVNMADRVIVLHDGGRSRQACRHR